MANDSSLMEIITCLANGRHISLVSHTIFTFACPIIFVVGIFGNVVGISVVCTVQKAPKVTSYMYVQCLALASTVFLTSGVFLQWLEPLTSLHLYNRSLIGCKLISYMENVSNSLCAWFIAIICFERLITFYAPKVKFKMAYSRRPEFVATATTIVIMGLEIWRPVLATTEISSHRNITMCRLKPGHTSLFKVFNTLNKIFGMFLPIAFTLIGTASIICKLRGFRSMMQQLAEEQTEYMLMTTVSGATHTTTGGGEVAELLPSRFRRQEKYLQLPGGGGRQVEAFPQQQTYHSNRLQSHVSELLIKTNEIKLTKTLLFTMIVFLVMYVPLYSYRLVIVFIDLAQLCFSGFYLPARYFQIVATCMFYFFHGVLPYVYVFTNPIMRGQLKVVLKTFFNKCSAFLCIICFGGY